MLSRVKQNLKYLNLKADIKLVPELGFNLREREYHSKE